MHRLLVYNNQGTRTLKLANARGSSMYKPGYPMASRRPPSRVPSTDGSTAPAPAKARVLNFLLYMDIIGMMLWTAYTCLAMLELTHVRYLEPQGFAILLTVSPGIGILWTILYLYYKSISVGHGRSDDYFWPFRDHLVTHLFFGAIATAFLWNFATYWNEHNLDLFRHRHDLTPPTLSGYDIRMWPSWMGIMLFIVGAFPFLLYTWLHAFTRHLQRRI